MPFLARQCINTYEVDIHCTAQQRLVNIMQKTLTNAVQWQNRKTCFLNSCVPGWVQSIYFLILSLPFFKQLSGMWQQTAACSHSASFLKKNKRFWPLSPPISTSKNTRGLSAFPGLATGVGFDIFFDFDRERGPTLCLVWVDG